MAPTEEQPSLAGRFRRHAEWLVGGDGSPLSAALMRAAAPDHGWPAAKATIEDHFDWIRERLKRTVQTNEPGRSTVLYSALLWLASQFHLPIRLLEIGASAGLNLIPDRYRYDVGPECLGDVASRVRFRDPWQPGPAIDLSAADHELEICARAGWDAKPLRAGDPEDRVALLSYIWPDEVDRIDRQRAAVDIAADAGVHVERRSARHWVFRQYVEAAEWAEIESLIRRALDTDSQRPTRLVGHGAGPPSSDRFRAHGAERRW